jgi:hypothetical protein
MEVLSRAARVLAVLWVAFAAPARAHGAGFEALYISPAWHNFRAEGMPLHTAADVKASLLLARDMGVRRVYWRGFQEDYLRRHAVVRRANFSLAEYWDWMRETAEKQGIHRAALGVGGLEMWGVFGIFDLGSDPREDAYCGAAAGYGPAVYSDSLREKYPGEIPLDEAGIRRECGPLRLSRPEVRRELIGRLVEVLEEGYAGLLLYTYMENLSLWFPGEFGAPLERAEVEAFLRELKAAMKGRKLALQVDAREAFRHGPSPWLGLTPDINTVGEVEVAWEDWVKEGLLDEVVFSIGPDAGAEAAALCETMAKKHPRARFSLLTRETLPPDSSCALAVDARNDSFRQQFLQRAAAVDALKSWARSLAGQAPEFDGLQGSAAITAAMSAWSFSPERVAWIVEKIREHREFPLRQQAAETLAAWNAGEAIARLAEDHDPAVRRVGYQAAAKMKSPEMARPLLEKAVADDDPYNRWVGYRGLARAPLDDRMQAVLEKGLRDEDATVRSVAAWLVRPGQKIAPALSETLRERFIALHDGETWAWEYRPVGDALMNSGAEGRAFLEKCLARAEEKPALADSAWRCLHIPQTGAALELVSRAEAERAYAAYPPALRGRMPRAGP